MVHVRPFEYRRVVGEELDRDGVKDGSDEGVDGWQFHRPADAVAEFSHPLGVSDQQDLAATGADFLDVGDHLVEERVGGHQHDHRHAFINEGDGTVLEFAGRVALGVDVADFFELERAFQGGGKVELPPQVQEVGAVGVFHGDAAHGVVAV